MKPSFASCQVWYAYLHLLRPQFATAADPSGPFQADPPRPSRALSPPSHSTLLGTQPPAFACSNYRTCHLHVHACWPLEGSSAVCTSPSRPRFLWLSTADTCAPSFAQHFSLLCHMFGSANLAYVCHLWPSIAHTCVGVHAVCVVLHVPARQRLFLTACPCQAEVPAWQTWFLAVCPCQAEALLGSMSLPGRGTSWKHVPARRR